MSVCLWENNLILSQPQRKIKRKGRERICSYRVLHDVGLMRHPGWVLHLKYHTNTLCKHSDTKQLLFFTVRMLQWLAQPHVLKATEPLIPYLAHTCKVSDLQIMIYKHNFWVTMCKSAKWSLYLLCYIFIIQEKDSYLVCWNRRHVRRHGRLSDHPVWNTVCWWEKSVDTE